MSKLVKVNADFPQRYLIQEAATILRKGGLVAFPTETVYGLGADALNRNAVAKIFKAKERPHWDPLIVHVRDLAMAEKLAIELPGPFLTLAEKFWPGPLTMVVLKSPRVPDEVTAGRVNVALRMPRHPVAVALLEETGQPIAAPSANKFSRPSPTRAEHVQDDLGKAVDMILDAGPTKMGVESTVLDLTQAAPAILRPGGVTREQLEAVIGPVSLAGSVADEVARNSPGMTPTHYAPLGRVELFEGEMDEVTNRIVARAIALRQRNHTVAAIVSDEMVPAVQHVTNLVSAFGPWGAWDRLAKKLFAAFRVFDQQGVVVILAVLPPPAGLGLAVRDRLQRAAGKS